MKGEHTHNPPLVLPEKVIVPGVSKVMEGGGIGLQGVPTPHPEPENASQTPSGPGNRHPGTGSCLSCGIRISLNKRFCLSCAVQAGLAHE